MWATYNSIGATYADTRRPDPRIADRIYQALGGAGTVINVGAGTGSYQPSHTVVAVEPSSVMIAQRPAGSARALEASAESIPIPYDCTDGFLAAFWRRPEAYLDPQVRAGISLFAQARDEVLQPGLARLSEDLSSGRWHQRHDDLLDREELDVGYRLVVADL
ncbi:hypothetical protein [Streptomyces sp. NPDC094472]|uniref:hypothetical protein n=1 Tax=unclassified Streptomyces TaxID=2593676 RepID=UPI00333246A1